MVSSPRRTAGSVKAESTRVCLYCGIMMIAIHHGQTQCLGCDSIMAGWWCPEEMAADGPRDFKALEPPMAPSCKRYGFLCRYRSGESVAQVRDVSNAALSSTSIGPASESRAPKLVHCGLGVPAPPRRQAPLQGANVPALQEDLDANWGG